MENGDGWSKVANTHTKRSFKYTQRKPQHVICFFHYSCATVPEGTGKQDGLQMKVKTDEMITNINYQIDPNLSI